MGASPQQNNILHAAGGDNAINNLKAPPAKEHIPESTSALPIIQDSNPGGASFSGITQNSVPISSSATTDFFDPALAPSNAPRRPLPVERMRKIDELEVHATMSDHALTVTLKGKIAGKGGVSASVHCVKPHWDNVMVVESSQASGGTGPIAYDIAMELSTKLGMPLVSDRGKVSDHAFKVWDYYLRERRDVQAVELSMGQWYDGQRSKEVTATLTENRTTWPVPEHPIWALWHGYMKQPQLISILGETGQIAINDRRSNVT
jgi:hypothetical protein